MAHAKKPRRLYFQQYFKPVPPKVQATESALLQTNGWDIPPILEDRSVDLDFLLDWIKPQVAAIDDKAPPVCLLVGNGQISHRDVLEFMATRNDVSVLIVPSRDAAADEPKPDLIALMRDFMDQHDRTFFDNDLTPS